MSLRRGQSAEAETAAKVATFRAGLDQAREMHRREDTTTATLSGELTFEDLTETEKSAALVGASPNDLNPIGFMNEAHYNALRTKNALASDLAQKIEVRPPRAHTHARAHTRTHTPTPSAPGVPRRRRREPVRPPPSPVRRHRGART